MLFDNLFLLNNNPKMEIKSRYMDEIEEFIVPLTSKFLPMLKFDMSSTVSNVKKEILG